jgi:hypothetical protein
MARARGLGLAAEFHRDNPELHARADMYGDMDGIDDRLLGEWTFQRKDDRFTIHRRAGESGFELLVNDNGRERTYRFGEFDRLVICQSDMETFLVRTGWSLADFTPDRRRADRRRFPRVSPDRRRWWTDVWRVWR